MESAEADFTDTLIVLFDHFTQVEGGCLAYPGASTKSRNNRIQLSLQPSNDPPLQASNITDEINSVKKHIKSSASKLLRTAEKQSLPA